MAQALYKQLYQQMIDDHPDLFQQFESIHSAYQINPQANQAKFNDIGNQILKIIQRTENQLCRQTERGGYGRYSSNLAEKFRQLVRQNFPKIDMVGIK